MLLLEHSAIFLTCIKQLSVLKTNFGLLFEWPLNSGLTVYRPLYSHMSFEDANNYTCNVCYFPLLLVIFLTLNT